MTPRVFVEGGHVDIEYPLSDNGVFVVSLSREELEELRSKLVDAAHLMQAVKCRTEVV